MPIKWLWEVLRDSGEAWVDDRAARIGAAIAFYMTLSLAPILVIALAVAGLVYGEEAARGEIAEKLIDFTGKEVAKTVEIVLANSRTQNSGIVAIVISSVVMLTGAMGVFVELQGALNDVWRVRSIPGKWFRTFLRDRLFSFLMVLGILLLLLATLIANSALDTMSEFIAKRGFAISNAQSFLKLAVTFFVEVVLFGMIFKVLPRANLFWSDVGIGAVLTTVLFNIGKYLIGLYLYYTSVTSAYGAAGSLLAFLLWIYYSVLVVMFGAEVTKVIAAKAGRVIRLSAHSEVIPGSQTPVCPDENKDDEIKS